MSRLRSDLELLLISGAETHTYRLRLSVGLDLLPTAGSENVPRDSQSSSPVSSLFFFKSFDPRPKVPLSPHLLCCFPVLKSLPLSCSSHLLQHVTLEGSDSSQNFCFAHFPLRCLLLYEAPNVARTGGFVAPLTYIAKDQPPALRTAEGEVRVVEWVGVFFSSATKTSRGGPCRRSDGRESIGKIKGPKGAASPVTWHLLCLYAMPPSTTQALQGRDRV